MGCPVPTIISLQNTSQLLHQLPLSTISILLLTATWSIESQYAREIVRNASCRVKCGTSSVELYELSWPPRLPKSSWDTLLFDTVLSEQWPSSLIKNGFQKGSRNRVNVEAHKNITSGVRWLPCIQIFTNQTGYVRPWAYRNSFDEEALVSELERFCERNGLQTLPTVKTIQGPKSKHLLTQNENKRVSDHLRLLSKDEFAKALEAAAAAEYKASGKIIGMAVVLEGGLPSLLGRHSKAWEAIATSVLADTWHKKIEWVITVVDSLSHANLVQRVGVADIVSWNGIALVLLDGGADETKVIKLTTDIASVRCVTEVLESFVYRKNSISAICRPNQAHREDSTRIEGRTISKEMQLLQTLQKPAAWHGHFELGQNRISLVDWLRGNYKSEEKTETMVWIIVYESWCAFCQRNLGVYRKLKAMVKDADAMVEVLMIEGCEDLNWWMDDMVDGFPTVFTLRSFGGHIQVSEYKGAHKIEELILEHGEANRAKLMRVVS